MSDNRPDKSRQIEFWVNAYNALTVRQSPLQRVSDQQHPESRRSPMGIQYLARPSNRRWEINSYSLGDIEHSILRPLKETACALCDCLWFEWLPAIAKQGLYRRANWKTN